MSRVLAVSGLALLALGGCQPLEPLGGSADFAQVATSPFPPSPAQAVKLARFDFTPASESVNIRVDEAARKLLAANPQAALQAQFKVIGAAQPEIFHIDQVVYLTERLVQLCPGEPELTAVLANELGKVISERESAVSAAARAVVPPPPTPLPIGSLGNPLASDPGYMIEMAKYEQAYPRAARNKLVPPPDPRAVARYLLTNAGLQAAELDAVAPILQNAAQHSTIQLQFQGVVAPDGTPWHPH